MITSIRIQNYKSLKDTVIHLDKVNLLIGANNSGKSNFLNALVDFQSILDLIISDQSNNSSIGFFRKLNEKRYKVNNKFSGEFKFELEFISEGRTVFLAIKINHNFEGHPYPLKGVVSSLSYFDELDEIFNWDLSESDLLNQKFYRFDSQIRKNYSLGSNLGDEVYYNFKEELLKLLENNLNQRYFFHFKPIISSFSGLSEAKPAQELNAEASNLVSFLYNLSQENKSIYQELINDLNKCIPEIKDVGLPIEDVGKLRIRFFDSHGNKFSADEVSEGILYFLAFLALIHQPNPPKVILLDEPETGIHPRRISELINYIFQLASEKDIQVIMASHSPLVLNEFKDIPEAVHVFDKEDGKTIIRNLEKDIINPQNEAFKKAGLKEIDFTDELSENWLMGLLNGVPND